MYPNPSAKAATAVRLSAEEGQVHFGASGGVCGTSTTNTCLQRDVLGVDLSDLGIVESHELDVFLPLLIAHANSDRMAAGR